MGCTDPNVKNESKLKQLWNSLQIEQNERATKEQIFKTLKEILIRSENSKKHKQFYDIYVNYRYKKANNIENSRTNKLFNHTFSFRPSLSHKTIYLAEAAKTKRNINDSKEFFKELSRENAKLVSWREKKKKEQEKDLLNVPLSN
jgi:hypothetical protein